LCPYYDDTPLLTFFGLRQVRNSLFTPNQLFKSTSIESVRYPLENRIWFTDPGQSSSSGSLYGGTYNKPIATGRVLDDGTTQLSQASYDTAGYFNLTQTVDPVGRTTSFAYSNHVDLAAISQTTAYGGYGDSALNYS
jgi:hypothetical protein